MQANLQHIKTLLVSVVLLMILGFTMHRNDQRRITLGKVHFTEGENLYITHEAVNKLLIQNEVGDSITFKETIDLNSLENALNSHKMIQEAQVYLTVDGHLEAKVKQRTPIARVLGKRHYYIDDQGKEMPLSPYHSARVPVVSGITDPKAMSEVYKLALFVQEDAFLSEYVTAIRYENELKLLLREQQFEVVFGKPVKMHEKVNKLKAFYLKAKKENALSNYKTVNLKYDHQVVSTKH